MSEEKEEKLEKEQALGKKTKVKSVKETPEKKNPKENADNESEQIKDELEGKLQEEKDKYLRLFAEFENYKKRTTKERLELFKTANEEVIVVLLPVLDDFERGLIEVNKSNDKELMKGMELIHNKLVNSLTQKGLTPIEAESGDEFDPELHEAITQIQAPSEEMKGKVIDVVEKGYKLSDKIIRYPKVVVGQ